MSARNQLVDLFAAEVAATSDFAKGVAVVKAAVLREAADEIDAETKTCKDDGVLEPDKFRPCRDASEQLRVKADAIERKVKYGCETPESHNYGCPCETKAAVS
jgi:hypothetical protein